jgi:hypothetical protein
VVADDDDPARAAFVAVGSGSGPIGGGTGRIASACVFGHSQVGDISVSMRDGSQLQNVTRLRAHRTRNAELDLLRQRRGLREELNDLPPAEYEQLNIKTDM